MEGKFIQTNNPKLKQLVGHMLDQIHLIVTTELAKNSKGYPQIKDVLLNEYLVMMQVCSMAQLELIHTTAKSTEMVSQITPDEGKRFMTMTDPERLEWATEKFGDIFEKERHRFDTEGS